MKSRYYYLYSNYRINIDWPYGVTVSTLDFESINPSSNLGRTSFFFLKEILSKFFISNKKIQLI